MSRVSTDLVRLPVCESLQYTGGRQAVTVAYGFTFTPS